MPGSSRFTRGQGFFGKLVTSGDATVGGNLTVTGSVTAGSIIGDVADLSVYNGTGSDITAGQLVYVNGYNVANACPTVALADADSGAGSDMATFIARSTITNATAGIVYRSWLSTANLNTNGSTVGNPVYLSTTAGGWTLTGPTGATAVQQVVGQVVVVSATVGQVNFDLEANARFKIHGTNELQALAVTPAKIALADGDILVGNAGAASDVALSGDATITNAGVLTIANSAVTGAKIANTTITGGKLAANTVSNTKLAGGFSNVTVAAGIDETGGSHQITVSGIQAGDEVVAVIVFTTAASIATMAAHAGTFTAGAGVITVGTPVNNTNNQYLIFWNNLTH